MIDEAAMAGADAVKFQLFKWEDVTRAPHLYDRKFELPPDWIPKLSDHAYEMKVDFLCTPFAPWACDVLRPHVQAWKMGSFEALRADLHLATKDKLRLISIGRMGEHERRKLMRRRPDDIFLHCVSLYPTRFSMSALWRLDRMLKKTRWVGFSDHTPGYEAMLVAIGLGCHLFEKHIQLQDQPESPDRGPWALPPDRFRGMVDLARQIERSMGDRNTKERCWNRKRYFARKEHEGERII